MQWIEQLFHVAPDGGNGITEAIVLSVTMLAAGVMIARRRVVKAKPMSSDR